MRVVKIDDFIGEQDSIHWLIDGLLPDVGWTLFCGLRGLGKTTFAVQMCDALQSGKPFLGRQTIKTRTLYIQADSVVIEWREMLKRITKQKGNTGFTAVEVPSMALLNDEYVARMANYVQIFKPGFVVFDSLYNLVGDNINTAKVLVYINKIKDIAQERPWLLIHHPPHEQSRAAGHSSLGANNSNEWFLLKTKLRIDKGRLVKDKEIPLTKDINALWELYKTSANGTSNAFLDKEI